MKFNKIEKQNKVMSRKTKQSEVKQEHKALKVILFNASHGLQNVIVLAIKLFALKAICD